MRELRPAGAGPPMERRTSVAPNRKAMETRAQYDLDAPDAKEKP